MNSILVAQDLVKSFTVRDARGRKSRFTAVDGVTLSVDAGESVAIVGESGSGKSTTARMLARLLSPTSGTVLFDGVDLSQAPGRELARLRREVQMVFQDPFSSLNPKHTVEQIIAAPLVYQGLARGAAARARVLELMERVGLNPDHARRYPRQFSGGQAQRIGIARALAVSPKVVICDEAVSALDVSVQARVLRLLRSLQDEFGLSYLFISHDLAVMRQIADRVVVMRGGRVVESGACAQLFAAPQSPYARELLAAVPRVGWKSSIA